MSVVIYKTIITFLVVYAILQMTCKLFKAVLSGYNGKKDIFVFIHVKNKEESIEYIVRCTIFNYLTKYGGRTVPYVVIVDDNSEDKTGEIAQKMCRDYDFLYYTTSNEYERFKEYINRR